MIRPLHRLRPALAPLAGALLVALAAAAPAAAQQRRVVVLGFDGADARTAAELMEQGQLPNLKALAEQGTFGPLLTTNPAESPVSWSSLNTGQNPAKTGVPGFVVRDADGAMPTFGFFYPEETPLERFDNAPIPVWPAWQLGAVAGALVCVGFLVVFGLLLRLRKVPVVLLSLALGGVAFAAGMRLRGYLPEQLTVVRNTLEATPFWEVAAAHGVPSVVLDAAQAWDREDVDGAKVLAGLGVPDARGQYNGFTIYTSDPLWFAYEPTKESETPSAGNKLRVDWKDGRIEGRVYGPRNFWREDAVNQAYQQVKAQQADPKLSFKELEELTAREQELLEQVERDKAGPPLSVELEVVRREDGSGALVRIGDSEQDLDLGGWSDWYPLTFDLNPLLKVYALTRAKLVSLDDPHFTLYVDTLQIDPERPPFWQPISQPFEFSAELAGATGPYETVGWACMTLPYKDREIDPVSFLQDIQFTFEWRRRMTLDRLERGDWRLFFSCLSTPDRVQHMCYQFYDPEHPLYDAEQADRKLTFFGEEITLRDAIPAIYRQVDRFVGEVRERLEPDDALILCADHGFQSFRRQVHLNNWLHEKGYLALKPRISRSSAKLVPMYVDWSKTRAYSIGLGMVYLNLKGRESEGIVEPAEAAELFAAITRDFLAEVDPQTGERIGRVAHVTSQIHEGPHLDREADLMLCFEAGYRVSWATTAGGLEVVRDESGAWVPGPFLEDNDKTWSGDHVSVDPELVRGMFYASVPLQVPEEGLDLRHIAPTVLSLLGVPVPTECDLAPLAER